MLGQHGDAARRHGASGRRAAMAQESFSDYHLYTLGRKTTINNSETKQVSMLGGTAVPVQKRYVVDGQSFYYRNAQHPGAPLKDVVQVFYQFKNEERGGPRHADAGRHRARLSGGLEGRRAVRRRGPHRPHAEGRDAQSEDRQRVRRRRASASRSTSRRSRANVYEVEYEITLRNHKATPITVEVNEPIGGTWRMLRASHDWTKTGGVGGAVHRAGRGRWDRRREIPGAHHGGLSLNGRSAIASRYGLLTECSARL